MTDLDRRLAQFSRTLDQPVKRIDTHGAVILLSGDRAYKFKKPVHFSFFDFRTLDLRKTTLIHELELNNRTAPMIYDRVEPLVQTADGVTLGGVGEIVEWVLCMHRFNQDDELDRMADRGELDAGLIIRLADQIAAFHQSLEPLDDFDVLTAMEEVIDGNEADLRASTPAVFDAVDVDMLVTRTNEVFQSARAVLAARARSGLVRHCHGDIHLANIVMIDDAPVLFDCIEFNDDFARIDLLYDLAFLVMDLIERGLDDHAQTLMQRYLERLPQDDGTGLLAWFVAIRATIRAKVTAFGGDAAAANTYLNLAIRALQPVPVRLIAIGGRSGTGKSTLARRLAPKTGPLPGAVILRSDVIRKAAWGVDETEKLPPEAYDEQRSREVFEAMAKRAERILKSGHAVIADGVFGASWQRQLIEQAAHAAGVPFSGIWLEGSEERLVDRVEQRTNDASDADADIVRAQAGLQDVQTNWLHVDATPSKDEIADHVRSRLFSRSG